MRIVLRSALPALVPLLAVATATAQAPGPQPAPAAPAAPATPSAPANAEEAPAPAPSPAPSPGGGSVYAPPRGGGDINAGLPSSSRPITGDQHDSFDLGSQSGGASVVFGGKGGSAV